MSSTATLQAPCKHLSTSHYNPQLLRKAFNTRLDGNAQRRLAPFDMMLGDMGRFAMNAPMHGPSNSCMLTIPHIIGRQASCRIYAIVHLGEVTSLYRGSLRRHAPHRGQAELPGHPEYASDGSSSVCSLWELSSWRRQHAMPALLAQ